MGNIKKKIKDYWIIEIIVSAVVVSLFLLFIISVF